MNSGAAAVPLWLILSTVVALAAGAVFLGKGLWPRRVGETPHCGRCDYVLIGNESGNCPECGKSLGDPGAVVLGERRRKVGLIVPGSIFAIVGVGMIVAATMEVDWYHWKPTTWVIDDLERGGALGQQAWGELNRRIKERGISAGNRERLIEFALAEQAKVPAGALWQNLGGF